MQEVTPEIGIVVIGRNERAHLTECLGALSAHRERIVYADSGSTDGSAELAERLGAVVVRLSEDRPLTAARGRNVGFKALRELWPTCRFVQFVDGDSVVDRDWIGAGAAFLWSNGHVAVVAGNCIEAHPEDSFYNWMCSEEWAKELGPNVPYGGNAMVRADALDEAGLFRTDMKAGEEAELAERLRSLGWETWRIDQPMVRHDAAIVSFVQWWKRASRGGVGYANAWLLTRSRPNPLYQAQLHSALVWVIGLPLIASVASAVAGARLLLLAIPVAYVAQIARIAARSGLRKARSWRYASMLMLAKVAEIIGVIEVFFSGRRRFDALDASLNSPGQEP